MPGFFQTASRTSEAWPEWTEGSRIDIDCLDASLVRSSKITISRGEDLLSFGEAGLELDDHFSNGAGFNQSVGGVDLIGSKMLFAEQRPEPAAVCKRRRLAQNVAVVLLAYSGQ